MIDPLRVLAEAQEAVPSMKYALGVAALGAVVAIVVGFGVDPIFSILGAVIVLAFMFLLVVFSAFADQQGAELRSLAFFLAWSFSIIVVATAGLVTSSYFFSWPKALSISDARAVDQSNEREENVNNSSRIASPEEYLVTDQASLEVVVNFHYGMSSLDPQSMHELDELIALLKEEPEAKLIIEGHATMGELQDRARLAAEDEVDLTDKEYSVYGYDVAERRADSVAAYLVAMGISRSRLAIRSSGALHPESESDMSKNRIVKVYVGFTIERFVLR